MPRRWNERSELFASIESHQTDLAKIFQPSIDIGGTQQYEEHFCIPAKIFNFARHKERNWRNSCEKPLPKRQEEHFEDFDFFVFEQITKKIDLFGEWNFRWNVQWESSKASLFFIHPDSLNFFSQISMMFVSSTGNQNHFVSFWPCCLFKCEEIQDGEALEDERKARHEKLAAAKVLPVERWCFFPPTVWRWAKLSWSFFFGHTLRIHVWYIHLHLVDFYGKCRFIFHMHGSYGIDSLTCLTGVFNRPNRQLPFISDFLLQTVAKTARNSWWRTLVRLLSAHPWAALWEDVGNTPLTLTRSTLHFRKPGPRTGDGTPKPLVGTSPKDLGTTNCQVGEDACWLVAKIFWRFPIIKR